MALEKAGYRANLEQIMKFFPEKNILNRKDIARYEGKDPRTIAKRYTFNRFGEMSIADYARQICT